MATLQVKGIDDDLYSALSVRARQNYRSISQEVVTMIQEGLSRPGNSMQKATEDFLALAGSWDDEKSADEIIVDIKNNRQNSRRFKGNKHVFD
ncbi:MAG: antitoxin [Candidatus Omnitrophota bacterium]|jgi:plasmid stability protein|nr:MAG: antitoxin [Candidatus Omnitrophota bacterium]